MNLRAYKGLSLRLRLYFIGSGPLASNEDEFLSLRASRVALAHRLPQRLQSND